MQPFMDFSQGFCLHTCHACTKACPTGAIKFLTSKEKLRVKIGTAKFKKSLCVVKTDGTDCAACAEHCPVQAIEMIPFGKLENSLYIPHVHEDVCIGCGACEYICPVTPHKAIVVQGIKVHKKAVVFDESMRIYKHQEKKKSAPAAVKPSGRQSVPILREARDTPRALLYFNILRGYNPTNIRMAQIAITAPVIVWFHRSNLPVQFPIYRIPYKRPPTISNIVPTVENENANATANTPAN